MPFKPYVPRVAPPLKGKPLDVLAEREEWRAKSETQRITRRASYVRDSGGNYVTINGCVRLRDMIWLNIQTDLDMDSIKGGETVDQVWDVTECAVVPLVEDGDGWQGRVVCMWTSPDETGRRGDVRHFVRYTISEKE